MPPLISAGWRSAAWRMFTSSSFIFTTMSIVSSARSACIRIGRATFSKTLMELNSAPLWNNTPIRWR